MKDLYSFSRDQAQHDEFYAKIEQAYRNVYERLGIGDITYKTFASGGSFAKFSHEFQTLADIGEDTIYLNETKKIAINQEVLNDEVLNHLGLKREELAEEKAVEVGNIFTFGSRYSEPLGLFFTDEKGISQPVFTGSYGIGISRLMGLLAELFADEKGLVWPAAVAPFDVYLARLGTTPTVVEAADKLYEQLTTGGISVLYDDRGETSPGEMFADADLLGMPWRLVVSERSLERGSAELKERAATDAQIVKLESVMDVLAKTS